MASAGGPVVQAYRDTDRREPEQRSIKVCESVVLGQQDVLTSKDSHEPHQEPPRSYKSAVPVCQEAPTSQDKQKVQAGLVKLCSSIPVIQEALTSKDSQKLQQVPLMPCESAVLKQQGPPASKDDQQPVRPLVSIQQETHSSKDNEKQTLEQELTENCEKHQKASTPKENNQEPQRETTGPSKPVIPVQKETPTSPNKHESYKRLHLPAERAVEAQGSFKEILTILGLYEYFPSKISILEAIVIKKDSGHSKLVDLPWMIIQKLFMIDYLARDEVWSLVKASEASKSDVDFDLNDFLETSSNDETEKNCNNDTGSNLSTLDVLVAIFTCCDNLLKQMLAEKLFVCKLAIPFLYPQGSASNVVMSLWALRTITVHCHTMDKEVKQITEAQVTEKPFPIVSFVRLGRPPISKSKLMNDILRDSSHNTFFHHDCNNGGIPRRMTNGLVECSWFVTAGKENDHLPCTTMFLNLRGDASVSKQMQFLQEISSVVFIIATFQDLAKSSNTEACKQIYNSRAKVILFLISGKDKHERKACVDALGEDFLKSVRYILSTRHGSQKNASEIKSECRRYLSEAIAMCSGMDMEKCAQLAKRNGIIIDEYVTDTPIEGRNLAKKVVSHMEDKQMIDCKSQLLPLQGNEWLEYCRLKKRQHRSKGTHSTSAYEADQMQQQMDILRKKQAEIGDNNRLTPFVKDFMSTLQKNQDVVLYFIKWMNMLLDEKSRATLPGLRKKYHSLWGKFQEAKKKQTEKDMKALKSEVDHAEHQLASASLGLENLFRELGQLYEALKESRKVGEDIKAVVEYLPEIAAKLLIKGIPLELIDGDASSVPISWVKAVLEKLENIIGEKRLFILSVLGIQSSGKSTLLNTMFGLKFAVSAGRCTRGAYMQLVPVDKNAELPFDYIVVVDTEGLRAPELGQLKHEHDNELATLVIGLGDVTIVNIKGENTAEMKDTLQIAVHAFLRMNLVSKHKEDHRSCIFIHQNVPAANAEALMMHGCQKLQEDLDKMTKEAAQSENIANISSFSQIINFDVQKHVWYISDLWHGDPPMAPANPGYSEKVNAIRLTLLKDIAKRKTSYLTPGDFSLRLEDLWNGVLADDFVYSFRNSLEMKAYTTLQSKYFTLEFELQRSLKEWFQNAEIKVKMSETVDELENTFQSQVSSLSRVLSQKATEIESSLSDYFENSNLKDVIIQWKQSKVNQLDFAVQQYRHEGKTDLLSVKEARKVEILQNQNWKEHETHILKKAVELAKKFKDTEVTDSELQKQFDSMWKPMVDELVSKNADKEVRIDSMMEDILFNRLGSLGPVLREELRCFPLHNPPTCGFLEASITEADIGKEHISLKKTWGKAIKQISSKAGLNEDPELQAKRETAKVTERILREISADLKKQSNDNTQFFKPYATEIIQKLQEKLDDYNQNAMTDTKYTFTILPTYYAKLAVHVSRYCVQTYTSMQLKYNKKYSVKAKLAASKNTAWSIFKNLVKQSTEEVIAADLLCTHLKDVIYETVKDKIPIQIVEDVLGDFQMTKYYLIVKILDDLAQKENFRDYKLYISNAKEFALRWVTQYTNKKIFSSGSGISRYAQIGKSHIMRIIKCVTESVEYATNEVTRSEVKTTSLWITHFCRNVSDEIAVPVSSLELMCAREVGNFENLQQIIIDQLDSSGQDTSVKEFLEIAFKRETEDSIDWDEKSPSKQIIERIWGCPEQCPFCKEPCTDTTNDHHSSFGKSHMCVQHRPEGVGGSHWYKDCFFEGVKHIKNELLTETCSYLVQCKNMTFRHSDSWYNYTEYKTCHKDWDIAPDSTNRGSKYWMWFMATYKHELKKMYGCELPNIPGSWNTITKEEALDDLRKYHN